MAANMACAESPSGAASVAEASRLDLKLRVSEDVWTGVTECGEVEASGPSTCKNSSNHPPAGCHPSRRLECLLWLLLLSLGACKI